MDTFRGDGELAALDDLDLLDWAVICLSWDILNLLYNVIALKDLAEDDVTTIQPTAGRMISNAQQRVVCISQNITYEVTTVVMKN